MQCHVPSHWNAKNRQAKNTGVVKPNQVHIPFSARFALSVKIVRKEIYKKKIALYLYNYMKLHSDLYGRYIYFIIHLLSLFFKIQTP